MPNKILSLMSFFIFRIFSNFYLLISIGSLIITYKVFFALEQVGVLSYAWQQIAYSLKVSYYIADKCLPKISNLPLTWECISSSNLNFSNFKYPSNELLNKASIYKYFYN